MALQERLNCIPSVRAIAAYDLHLPPHSALLHKCITRTMLCDRHSQLEALQCDR